MAYSFGTVLDNEVRTNSNDPVVGCIIAKNRGRFQELFFHRQGSGDSRRMFEVRKAYGCPVRGIGGLIIVIQMSVRLEEHEGLK